MCRGILRWPSEQPRLPFQDEIITTIWLLCEKDLRYLHLPIADVPLQKVSFR